MGQGIDPTTDVFLSEPEVRRIVGNIHRTTLYRWTKSGYFPQPKKLGVGRGGRIGYSRREVEAWMESRKTGGTHD